MAGKRQKITKAKTLALCGVFAALACVFMLLGSVLPLANLIAPMLAALCVLPALQQAGNKFALLTYVCVSLLSLLFTSNPEGLVLYIVLLGPYPIVQGKINLIKSKIIKFIIKSAIYYAAIFVAYFVVMRLFFPVVLQQFAAEGMLMLVGMALAGQLAFFMFDMLLLRVGLVYMLRFNTAKKTN